MIRSELSDYSDAYIRVSGTITTTGVGDDDNAKRTDKRNKEWYLKIVHHLLIVMMQNI